MDGKIFSLLVLGAVFMLCASAFADVDLDIRRIRHTAIEDGSPEDGDDLVIKTDIFGEVEFEVLVRNTDLADEEAEDVLLDFSLEAVDTDMEFSVKPSKKDIGVGDSEIYVVSLTGVEPEIKNLEVEVIAEGEDGDGDLAQSTGVRFFISYPSPRLEITDPDNDVDILELGAERSFNLNIIVKNVGDTTLFDLMPTIETKYGNVTCEILNQIEELKVSRIDTIKLTCTNVYDGDGILFKVRESENQTSDIRSIDLHIVPGAPIYIPDEPVVVIRSPMNGEVIELKDENKQIPVTVANEGRLEAEGVCVSWTGIEAIGDDCADIAPNETKTYVIAVSDIPESADIVITAGDKEGFSKDNVSVSIIKGRTSYDVEWEENQSVVVESNVSDVSNVSEGGEAGDAPAEEEDPTLKYIIVGVVALILVAYIAIGMTRKKRSIISQQ